MKRLVLFLMLFVPLASMAQFDDVYFVPKKEKKTVVERSSEGSYFVDVEDYYESEFTDTLYVDSLIVLDGVKSGSRSFSYTNDPDWLIDNNYRYSSRIIRFRSPGRLFGENLYWDLVYGCGINDWLVYDNGFAIEIYPTVNNPLFYLGRSCMSLSLFNYSTWRTYSSWLSVYNGWAPHPYYGFYRDYSWCYHNNWWRYNNHAHGAYRLPLTVYKDVPVNSDIRKEYKGERPGRDGITLDGTRRGGTMRISSSTERGLRRGIAVNSGETVKNKEEKKNDNGTVAMRKERGPRGNASISLDNIRQNKDKRVDNSTLRRQQPNRRGNQSVGAQSGNGSVNRDNGAANGIRRQQPRREAGISLKARDDNKGQSATVVVQRREPSRNSSVGSQNGNRGGSRSGSTVNVRQMRRSNESSYGSSSSSNGYNRPSSTSVSRSRSTSSSYSGSSSERSGSSYSGGSSSVSRGGSGSVSRGGSGGGSRGGSGGGSRGGSRR